MELKSVSRRIGDIEVTVTEFPAWDGIRMIPRLGTIAGSLIAAAGNGGDLQSALSVVPAICSEISKDEDLILDLLKYTTVTKAGTVFPIESKEKFNVAFAGDLWGAIEAIKLVLEVSFSDFLSRVMGALGDAAPDPKGESD